MKEKIKTNKIETIKNYINEKTERTVKDENPEKNKSLTEWLELMQEIQEDIQQTSSNGCYAGAAALYLEMARMYVGLVRDPKVTLTSEDFQKYDILYKSALKKAGQLLEEDQKISWGLKGRFDHSTETAQESIESGNLCIIEATHKTSVLDRIIDMAIGVAWYTDAVIVDIVESKGKKSFDIKKKIDSYREIVLVNIDKMATSEKGVLYESTKRPLPKRYEKVISKKHTANIVNNDDQNSIKKDDPIK